MSSILLSWVEVACADLARAWSLRGEKYVCECDVNDVSEWC